MKLTREDLVQICGPADGIRLFNALKSRCVCVCVSFVCVCEADGTLMFCICLCRSVRPRLTMYICQESPVVERHGTNENGDNNISSGLHGKKKKKKKFKTLWLCSLYDFLSFLCSVSCSVSGGAHSCRTDPQDRVCVQPSTRNNQPGVQTGSDRHTHPSQ